MGAIQDFFQIYIKFKTFRQILLRSNENGIVLITVHTYKGVISITVPICTIFKTYYLINKDSVLTKFHDDRIENAWSVIYETICIKVGKYCFFLCKKGLVA